MWKIFSIFKRKKKQKQSTETMVFVQRFSFKKKKMVYDTYIVDKDGNKKLVDSGD